MYLLRTGEAISFRKKTYIYIYINGFRHFSQYWFSKYSFEAKAQKKLFFLQKIYTLNILFA